MFKQINFKQPYKRNFFLLLFFNIIFFSNIICQDNQSIYKTIDSLRDLSIEYKNDTLRLVNFTLMAKYYRYVNIDSSKILLRKAIELHKLKKVDNKMHAFAYNVIADIYRLEQNVDSTKYYYKEGVNWFQNEIDPSPLLALASPYGNFLVKNKEIDKGVEVLQKAIQLAIENDDNHNLSFLYASLGNIIYSVQNDNLTAASIFKKGIESSKNIDSISFKRVNTGFNLGLAKIFLDQNNIDSTIVYAKKALRMSEEVQYFQKALVSCNILCQSYLMQDEFEMANHYNEKAFSLFSEVRSIESIIDAKVLQVAIHRKTNLFDEAISFGNQLLNDHLNRLNDEQNEELYNYLFDSYTIIGDKSNSIRLKDSLIAYTHRNYDKEHGKLLAKLYDETLVIEQKAKNRLLVIQQEESKKRLALQEKLVLVLILTLVFAIGWGITTFRLYKRKNELSRNLEKLVNERTKDLKKANDELEQSNSELRTLTYIASHDVKEPMRNIGGFVSMIQRKLPREYSDRLNEEFSFIKKSIKQLYTLVEDITKYINFSKNEGITIGQVNLEKIIEKIKSELPDHLKDKKSQIKYDDLTSISANNSAMYFVLKNLIENGLKYNENKQPTVKIFQKETENEIQISVSDNGLGIAEEYHEKIFEMHKRLHTRDKYEGSGLGLSIANILVKKLKGRIELKSRVSAGSTFIVCLPKAQSIYRKNPAANDHD